MWLAENKFSITGYVGNAAASCGSIEILKWLLDRGITFSDYIYHSALHGSDNVNVIKWLVEQDHDIEIETFDRSEIIYDVALNSGSIELADIMLRAGFDDLHNLTIGTLNGGHIDLLNWLEDKKLLHEQEPGDFCRAAAFYGQIEVIKWLRKREYEWDHWTCVTAAADGEEEMLYWLLRNGCPYDRDGLLKFVPDHIKNNVLKIIDSL
jgi:hypothetical protein